MRLIFILALALASSLVRAQTINAVYFGQTHVLKATDPYFGLVGNREALIKVHVTAPGAPASPAVTATLSLSGQAPLVLPLTGPATLPASIPDGLGVVQHSFANTFTGYIPAAWVKTGLQVTVNAGTASTTITNMKVGAPTKIVMTMTDVQYFSDTNSDYPSGLFAELEAKLPVADLEVRRLGHVVFPELVIPPRTDVGTKAARIRSKAEYTAKTGLAFDGEQAAALAWNGALKRAAGRSGRWSLYYLNVYNAFAGGQAGGFAGVGSGTSEGILHHELGHALSLPHWGDSAAYPYKGDMHGIQAPAIYNDTHAGPAWAFHLPTKKFIPPTVQSGNVGGKPVGTYKVDPMQGGGTGYQEPGYLLNHFSDYSANQMRNYLNDHVVVWNPALGSSGSWAEWNQTTGGYTTTVSNNGVQFPTTRDTQVISIMASISGSDPDVTMVYPPIGPYTSGLIRLFDPTVAADRTAANNIFSPSSGSDLCVRVVQGGVTKTYMLAASWVTSQDPFSTGSLVTEAINLPASDGAVTKIELLLTPDAEVNGLPANPQVLSTWAPLTPEPAEFELAPTAFSNSAVTMKAVKGNLAFGFTGTVEYQFTETSGNPGATSSAWQTSRTYTDTGLQAGTPYSYTVSMRAGTQTATTSAAASATTLAAATTRSVTVNSTQQFSLPANLEGFQPVTGLGTFDAGTADKLVVVVSTEDRNNSGTGYVYDVRYNGKVMTEVIQEEAGSGNGTAAIFYLDNPGPIGTGTIEVSAENPNGGIGAAYALSNTMAGFAVTNSRTGTTANSVSFTTAGVNSAVIAVLENSGNPNSSGTPTVNAAAATPLTQVSSGSWGGGYGGHASGYRLVATPSAVTPAFTTTTGSGYSINLAAAEFPAKPPQPNIWAQTAGGAQNWTTPTNWEDAIVPAPTSSTTMDFSAVDLLADTNLSMGANRTARIWKFGDTSGTQNWTVSSGNTMTLAGTTPTIEVKNNTTQLNNVVAGTAGLAKTGTGTLFLNGNNTYTGVTRISAGTLQAATLANGSSNSSIGASSNAVGNLILNGGTLQYTGPAVSTNRLFSLQASSSIDASGTGAVNFTNTGAMGFSSSTADKTLTLTGANTGANTLAAIIGDNLTTVTIGNQDITTGVTSLTKSGTGTWVLSGANTYTGLTIIGGGTLRLTNPAAVQNSRQVNINNGTNPGTLHLATDTAFATFPIIGGGSSAQATIVSDRATAGAGITHVLGEANFGVNTYHFTSGTNVTSGTGGISFPKVNLSGGVDGSTLFNPTTANLTIAGGLTIPSGGTTKALNLGGTSIGNSINGAITNGIGTLSLTKSNTGTWTLSGLSATATDNYSGGTLIDNGTLRITSTNPSLTGSLTFGSTTGGTNSGILDLTSSSATFAGAFLARTNSTNSITIGSGRTLQINAAFTVGFNTTALPHSSTGVEITGSGTLSIGNSAAPTNATVQIGNGATTNVGNSGILDMSGLSTFFANLGTGSFRVGSPTNSGSANGGGSTVLLASNSTIQAATLLLGSPDGSANGGATAVQSLKLGSGATVINVDTLNLGGIGTGDGRSNGSLTFSGATGTLKIRSQTDSVNGRTNLNIGVVNMNTGVGQPSNLFDTTGHSADLRFGTMNLGIRTLGTGPTTAQFKFDAGTLDANDLTSGSRGGSAGAAASATGIISLGGGSVTINNTTNPVQLGVNTLGSGTASGTLNISGGSVIVAANGGNSIRLGNAPAASGTANGTLNLTGGTLTVAGDIIRGASTGTSNAAVNLNGGTLNMNNHDIGASGIGGITFTVESGTLQNVASINGTSGLNKTSTGTLVLQGNNTYKGDTTVSDGTLILADNAQLTFVIGATSGTNNRITGSGIVAVNGDFNMDTTLTDASPLTSGSWMIVNTAGLTESYGSTFAIAGAGWSEANNVWTRTVGNKKYTFTEATGILTLSSAASYTSWIEGFFPGVSDLTIIGADRDPDQDGIPNGVEMVIGGNPQLIMDASLLPTLEMVTHPVTSPTIPSGSYLLFTYRRSDLSTNAGITATCETASSLAGSWIPTIAIPGVVIQVDDNFNFTPPANSPTDRVRVYVPRASNATQFGRLKVLVP